MTYKSTLRKEVDSDDPPFAQLKPGAGPRHMVFRPDGKFACDNELDSTITAFAYDQKTGVLKELQTLSSLPVIMTGQIPRRRLESFLPANSFSRPIVQ